MSDAAQTTPSQPPQAGIDPAKPAAPQPVVVAEQPPVEPLYKGMTGDINSPAELASYAKSLEEKLIAEKAKVPVYTPQPIPNLTHSPDLADMLFSDPQKVVDMIKSDVMTQVKKAEADKEADRLFWENFYAKNEDLKKQNRIVQSLAKDKFADYAKLTREEAAKRLANDARELVSEVRRNSGVTESELPQNPNVGMGSSGGSIARPAQAPPAPMNMTEQLKSINRKRTKSL